MADLNISKPFAGDSAIVGGNKKTATGSKRKNAPGSGSADTSPKSKQCLLLRLSDGTAGWNGWTRILCVCLSTY